MYELPGVVRRYAAALFRSGHVGPPDTEWSRRAALITESLNAIIDAIKPDKTSGEVHSASQAVFEKHGYRELLSHRSAYSIGVNYPPDWGEGNIMSIWEGDERRLRPGMTFHLVPGFYDLTKYAIFMSETVLVTDDGCEVITQFPREVFIC